MTRLRELSYQEVVKRLRRLGFRLYGRGKGSHELWVRDADGRVVPVPHYKGKKIRSGRIYEDMIILRCVAPHLSKRFITKQAFCPPKPNALTSAASTLA
ncbi:MAG: type II toxin-antitoxin system HicA family toxin [Anaerolineae bacterium]